MAMAQARCASRHSQEAASWAKTHFGNARLGDSRRTRRLVDIAAAMVESPGMSLPKQLPDWSDLVGAYRLLSNDKVTPQAIVQGHVDMIKREAGKHPVVLCVQDGTQLDFTCRTGIRGLGMTGDSQGRGLRQHTALAVLPDKRLLGILGLAWHAIEKAPPQETRRQRQTRWTVGHVWHEAAGRIGTWPPGSHLVHVGDREADMFRFMHEARTLGHGFVLRARMDRYVDHDTQHLWQKLEGAESLGTLKVALGEQRDKGNRINRVGREAELTIRVAPILVGPPRNDPRTQGMPPLSMYGVYLLEEHPPEGAEAVEWMLLTSLEVTTRQQAETIIGYYTCRWVIEEWHRCLKEGCRVESSQLDDAVDIQRLTGVLAIVAVRLLQMRDLAEGDGGSDSPEALEKVVPATYRLLAASMAGISFESLTPRMFWRIIAKRGGYLARKHDPRPGWKVLWRGWNDFVQMARGVELYQKIARRSP